MRKIWMIAAASVAVVGSLAMVQAQGGDQATSAAPQTATNPTDQPINFPHSVHAGTYQMDCQYCHFSADRSRSAGIPPVSSCMGCHTMIPGEAAAAEINKLREYWQNGETIPWIRIHKVADHVHFPHNRHVVNAGLECQECHGPVETLENAWEVPYEEWGKGKMGWCISCHVESDAPRDCTLCHY